MALDQLIATMEARGETEVREILSAALAEALTLTREARARMEKRRADAVTAVEHQSQTRANAVLAEARREAAAAVLEARADAIERVWHASRSLLTQTSTRKRLRAVVGDHVREALPYLDGRDIVVRCAKDIVKEVRAAVDGRGASLSVEIDDDVLSGVIVAAADGTVEIDNTLEARMARLRPRLATELTGKLAELVGQRPESAP